MVVDLLISTLSILNYPIYRQGTLSKDDKYDDTFITFWDNSSDGNSYYDNEEHRIDWDFDVNVYSNNPELPYSILDQIKGLLKEEGFIVTGKGYDLYSDEVTHTGRGINVKKIEIL